MSTSRASLPVQILVWACVIAVAWVIASAVAPRDPLERKGVLMLSLVVFLVGERVVGFLRRRFGS